MDIAKYLQAVQATINNLDPEVIASFATHLENAYNSNQSIYVIGNGGSAANASHFAQDLAKGIFFEKPVAKTMKAISLTDNVAHITAIANDTGYQNIFSAQLNTYANTGDVLVCISGSGNSENIVEAVKAAKQKNMFVIGVTGFDGGQLKSMSNFSVHVPLHEMCTVESIHSIIFHLIVLELRERLAGQKVSGI
jgi:D-sedoheptulose 7-phosphate isomerase